MLMKSKPSKSLQESESNLLLLSLLLFAIPSPFFPLPSPRLLKLSHPAHCRIGT